MSLILEENGSIPRHGMIVKIWKTEDKEHVLRTLFFMRLIESRLLQNEEKARKNIRD